MEFGGFNRVFLVLHPRRQTSRIKIYKPLVMIYTHYQAATNSFKIFRIIITTRLLNLKSGVKNRKRGSYNAIWYTDLSATLQELMKSSNIVQFRLTWSLMTKHVIYKHSLEHNTVLRIGHIQIHNVRYWMLQIHDLLL